MPSTPGRRGASIALLASTLLVLPIPGLAADSPAAVTREAAERFERQIRPLLAARCFACHGETKQKGGLRLDSRAAALTGGESGPAIVPGNAAGSRLVRAIHYRGPEMPPAGKLPPGEIELLEAWIAGGAPWPGDNSAGHAARGREFRITDEDRAYWAFQPLRRLSAPPVQRPEWATNDIDKFILARLETEGLEPNPEASPRELVRRLYFDLIGLPPTAEEVEAFEADPSPAAYEQLIDRLLARPQHGERWGRHWLDVVRFAQSNGYERDGEKPFAWRYRDYVIAAFNQDKPFDQFVREQLAGDELDQVTRDTIIATGFYRLGVWDDEPDDKRAAELDEQDDVLRTIGAAFLGLSIGCARCHHHMYDPIPQEDYYRFLSFVHNVRPMANPAYALDSPTYAPLASSTELGEWLAGRDQRLRELEEKAKGLGTGGEADRKKLDEEIQAQRASQPPFEWALAVRERGPTAPPAHVLVRGNPAQPGAEVEPAFLAVLGGEKPALPAARHGAASSGRRRALAEWIASPRNPLTARVIANRLWQHHFGRGIVATPDDLGKAGVPPTHPELLDWLAQEIVDGGWRLKRMHKLIALSSTYRMSSRVRADRAAAVDPGNRLWWRRDLRRLEAEAIRDAVLSASGRLSLEAGGRGFFPRLEGEVVAGLSRPGLGWGTSSDEERARRSVYAFVKRTMRVPFLEIFDYANTDQPASLRPVTTVAPQALLLLNSELLQEEALAFARRIEQAAGGDRERQIETAFRLALSRSPTTAERAAARDCLERRASALASASTALHVSPEAPAALEKGYLDRLSPGDVISASAPGWQTAKGAWLDHGEGIWWVDRDRGPFVLRPEESLLDGGVECEAVLHPGVELAGLLLRARPLGDGFTGYELLWDVENGSVALRRHAGGVTELARHPMELPPGARVHAHIELIGGRVAAVLEPGGVRLEATDAEPLATPGQIGLRVAGAPLTVSRLTLEAAGKTVSLLESPAPAAMTLETLRALALTLFNLNELVHVD